MQEHQQSDRQHPLGEIEDGADGVAHLRTVAHRHGKPCSAGCCDGQ